MSAPPASSPDVHAAGAVVCDPDGRVALVHRPRYDDWSFPKGKHDPGEHATAAAVREVAEETGLGVRLGVPLAGQRYRIADGRLKQVHYWLGRLVDPGAADVSTYTRGDEIDRVGWFAPDEARAILTHDHDRVTLSEALGTPADTEPLVVLRHGQAHPRKRWREADRLRPLVPAGRDEAIALVPVLGAYGVRRVVTSPSTRCAETVLPYAGARGVRPLDETALTEEEGAAGPVGELVRGLVDGLLDAGPTVVCTHRPVLPHVLAALGVPDPHLPPAGLLVAHLRAGTGDVVATETHRVALPAG